MLEISFNFCSAGDRACEDADAAQVEVACSSSGPVKGGGGGGASGCCCPLFVPLSLPSPFPVPFLDLRDFVLVLRGLCLGLLAPATQNEPDVVFMILC